MYGNIKGAILMNAFNPGNLTGNGK